MTVKELKKALEKANDDDIVRIFGYHNTGSNITSAYPTHENEKRIFAINSNIDDSR